MGGMNIGDIFSTLKLDTSEYLDAIRKSNNESRLLQIQLKNLSKDVEVFYEELLRAGASTESITKLIIRLKGATEAESVAASDWVRNLGKVQEELRKVGVQIDQGIKQREKDLVSADHAWGHADRAVAAESVRVSKEVNDAWGEFERNRRREAKATEQHAKATLKDELRAHKEGVDEKKRNIQEELDLDRRAADLSYKLAQQQNERRRRLDRERFNDFRDSGIFASGMQHFGVTGMAAFSAPIGGAIWGAKESAEFQDALQKSISIMGQFGVALKTEFADAARKAAKETGISAKEMAGNFYQLASAGFSARDSLAALPTVSKFAVAANADLQKSTELLTDTMNAMGGSQKDLERIASLLLKADQMAAGTAEQFAKSLAGKGAGALRILGKDLEEGLAILATFAKMGIKGKEAQEALTQSLRDFRVQAERHKDVQITVNGQQLRYKDLIYDTQGQMRNYASILKTLEDLFAGMSVEQRTSTLMMLGFQDRTAKAIIPLIGFSSAMRDFEDQLRRSGNVLQETFDRRMDSPIKRLEVLKARFVDLLLTIGGPTIAVFEAVVAALGPVISTIETAAKWFSSLSKETQTWVVGAGLAAAAAGLWASAMLILGSRIIQTAAFITYLSGANALGGISGLFGTAGAAAATWAGKLGLVAAALATIYVLGKNILDQGNNGVFVSQPSADPVAVPGMQNLGLMDRLDRWMFGSPKAKVVVQTQTPKSQDPFFDIKEQARKAQMEIASLFENSVVDLDKLEKEAVKKARETARELAGIRKENSAIPFAEKSLAGEILTEGVRKLAAEHKKLAIEIYESGLTVDQFFAKMKAGAAASVGLSMLDVAPVVSWGGQIEKATKAVDKLLDTLGKDALQLEIDRTNQALNDLGVNADRGNLPKLIADYQHLEAQFHKNAISATTLNEAYVHLIKAKDAAGAATKEEIRLALALESNLKGSMSNIRRASVEMARDIQRQIGQTIRNTWNNLFDMIMPTGETNKLAPVVSALREAFNGLSAFSDPKRALQAVVDSIRNAGSAAQANAIAIRHFGESAGPRLAREIRSGALSVSDLSKAIDQASRSTTEYEANSSSKLSGITKLWRDLVRDVTGMIAKVLIEQGLLALLKWMNLIDKNTKSLGDGMVQVFKKIGVAIGDVLGLTKDVAKTTVGIAGDVAGNVPLGPDGVPLGGIGKAGGSIGSSVGKASSGLASWISAISSAATAISSIVGNFQMFGMNKSLDLLVNHSLREFNEIFQQRIDHWTQYQGVYQRLGEIWMAVSEGLLNIFNRLGEVGGLQLAGAGGGGNIFISGDVIIQQANNVDQIVRELKSRRVVRGIGG